LNARQCSVAIGVAVVGVALAVIFLLFEIRIRELLDAGEGALKRLEALLADDCGVTALRIVTSVEQPRIGWCRYSRIIRAMYVISLLGWLAAAVFAGRARC
jgi:hypothetical protein